MKKFLASLLLAAAVYFPSPTANAAIRFSQDIATNPRLIASGLPTSDPFSMTFWVYLAGNDSNRQKFVDYSDGGSNPAPIAIGLDTTLHLELHLDGSVPQTSGATTLATGNWYYVGVTRTGTAFKAFLATATTAAAQEISVTNTVYGATATEFDIGAIRTNRPCNCRVAALKVWSGLDIGLAGVQNEQWSYRPKTLANLYTWQPLLSYVTPENDLSGTAHYFTKDGGSGTITTEDGPPISW